jgi:adenine phosphoribosyltransferase
MGRLAGRDGGVWRGGAHQPDLPGIESGFLTPPLALKLGCGFIMLRKRSKLPGVTVGLNYSLEYGTDRARSAADGEAGQRVAVVDDLRHRRPRRQALVLRQVGAVVPGGGAVELTFLSDRKRSMCRARRFLVTNKAGAGGIFA